MGDPQEDCNTGWGAARGLVSWSSNCILCNGATRQQSSCVAWSAYCPDTPATNINNNSRHTPFKLNCSNYSVRGCRRPTLHWHLEVESREAVCCWVPRRPGHVDGKHLQAGLRHPSPIICLHLMHTSCYIIKTLQSVHAATKGLAEPTCFSSVLY